MFHVSPEHAEKFPLKLPIPHWSTQNRVLVNDQPVPEVKPGAYLTLDREWKPGDTIEMNLDMSLHYWAGEKECTCKTSIYRDPLLLVYEFPRNGDQTKPEFDTAMMKEKIVPANGELATPMLLLEINDTAGKPVRLRDYGTAGDRGIRYASWLNVKNVKATPFSEANPLRSSRSTQ